MNLCYMRCIARPHSSTTSLREISVCLQDILGGIVDWSVCLYLRKAAKVMALAVFLANLNSRAVNGII